MDDRGHPSWVEAGIRTATALVDPDDGTGWTTAVLHGTGGGTFGGSAIVRLARADERFVVKLIQRNGTPRAHPLNWRRELDVYESQWLRDRLPAGIALPRCHASTVTDTAAVIVMEAVDFDEPANRSLAWYGDLAVELGRFGGASLDAVDIPAWATRGFLRHEMDAALEVFPAMLAEPVDAMSDLVEMWRPYLRRLISITGPLITALDREPACLNHLDVFSRNATRVGDRFVLIDWAYAGLAPVGADAAAMLVITAIFGDVPLADFDAFSDAVLLGYVRGLGDTRAKIPADRVRRCIDQLVVLRFAKFLTQLHGMGNAMPSVIESVSGRPFEDSLARYVSAADAFVPYAERALSTLDA